MRNMQSTLLALALLVSTAGTAAATSFQLGDPSGAFALGAGWGSGSEDTLDVEWTIASGLANHSFELVNANDSHSLLYGQATMHEVNIALTERDDLDITAHLEIVLPEILGTSHFGLTGTAAGDTDDPHADLSVFFDPVQIGFGNGGLLEVALSPVIAFGPGQTQDIWATFTLIEPELEGVGGTPPTPTGAMPEPSAVALFGIGSLIVSRVIRRRRA